MIGDDEMEKSRVVVGKKTVKTREELSETFRSQELNFECISVGSFCATNLLAASGQKQ